MKYTLSIIALIMVAILGYTLFFSSTQSVTNERTAAQSVMDSDKLAPIQDNQPPESTGADALPTSETVSMEKDTAITTNNTVGIALTKQMAAVPKAMNIQTALLANGCFWCAEHDLAAVTGVIDAISGYAGGSSENPTYKNYIGSGHREVVLVTYDANVVSFANLVENVIKHGDPTDAEGSYFDRGLEYAPAIYYENDAERDAALAIIAKIDALKVFDAPVPLLVTPRSPFWPAEEYHQDYAKKNPVRYNYYRSRSGRDTFIQKYWGDNAGAFTVSNTITQTQQQTSMATSQETHPWESFVKPSEETLRVQLTEEQYRVTQEDSTEKPFANDYDKNYAEGVYVDVVSGEPLYLSKDKYDSGSGWPSFVKPISPEVVVQREDDRLFSTRTEVRSRYADSHLGHVFNDGPADRGGMRYCMNSAALRFIPKVDMEREGYVHLMDRI